VSFTNLYRLNLLNIFLTICPIVLQAQSVPATVPPSQDSLDHITARGRLMYEYDQVAWHGTDAMMKLRQSLNDPITARTAVYVVERTTTGWRFLNGSFNTAKDTFFVAYEATRSTSDTTMTAHAVRPARPETGSALFVVRATTLARETFGPVQRQYNSIVIPANNGKWLVYVLPASSNAGWILGADARYHISADGRTVLESRRLHNGVITYPTIRSNQPAPTSGAHSNVRDNIPEDTDVFLVLTRTPHIPELIVTDAFVYVVGADGRISYKGRREDVIRH
jgi:hypothetical protein